MSTQKQQILADLNSGKTINIYDYAMPENSARRVTSELKTEGHPIIRVGFGQYKLHRGDPDPTPPSLSKRALNRLRDSDISDWMATLKDGPFDRRSANRMPVPQTRDTTRPALVALWSDHHFGLVVHHPVTGERIYDIEIANRYLDEITAELIRIGLENDADEIVILLAGDMIENDTMRVYQWVGVENVATLQMKAAVEAYWRAVLSLSEHFRVRVYSARGNHGRTTTRTKEPENNFDDVIAHTLDHLARHHHEMTGETIEINLPGSNNSINDFARAEIKGTLGLVRHKAPFKDNLARWTAKLAGWDMHHRFDWLAFGHVHNWGVLNFFGKPGFRNGSLMGIDPYAEELGFHDVPAQLAWLIGGPGDVGKTVFRIEPTITWGDTS